MANYGHDETMKTVRIAELKSGLSRHLRSVRAGASLTVLDRATPIALLVPLDHADAGWVTKPDPHAPPVGRVRLPARTRTEVDVVRMLLDDRQRRV
jgi:antitoxin (DNA-binding transcriptional repressor) of toxin-antitoxin stability system